MNFLPRSPSGWVNVPLVAMWTFSAGITAIWITCGGRCFGSGYLAMCVLAQLGVACVAVVLGIAFLFFDRSKSFETLFLGGYGLFLVAHLLPELCK
jgi:hypothetical protein